MRLRSLTLHRTHLLCVGLLTLLLAACGFQLRGHYSLPFDSIYLGLSETGELHAQLKRAIRATSPATVTSAANEAAVSLQVLGDHQEKNILSLSAAGRAQEYQLVRNFSFRLIDAQGREWIAPSQIRLQRDISFNDDLVLSKESEEVLLWRDMQSDLVQQLLRRLSAARAPAATLTQTPAIAPTAEPLPAAASRD